MNIKEKLVKEKTNSWAIQLFRYIFVGGYGFMWLVLFVICDDIFYSRTPCELFHQYQVGVP